MNQGTHWLARHAQCARRKTQPATIWGISLQNYHRCNQNPHAVSQVTFYTGMHLESVLRYPALNARHSSIVETIAFGIAYRSASRSETGRQGALSLFSVPFCPQAHPSRTAWAPPPTSVCRQLYFPATWGVHVVTVVSGKSSVGGEVWLAICKGFNTDQSRRCTQLRATVFCFRCGGVISELTDLMFHLHYFCLLPQYFRHEG
jgi:hypothetical protein